MEWCMKLYAKRTAGRYMRYTAVIVLSALMFCLFRGEAGGRDRLSEFRPAEETAGGNKAASEPEGIPDLSGYGNDASFALPAEAQEICVINSCASAAMEFGKDLSVPAAERPEDRTENTRTDRMEYAEAQESRESLTDSGFGTATTPAVSAGSITDVPDSAVEEETEYTDDIISGPEELPVVPEEVPAVPEEVPAGPEEPAPSVPVMKVADGFFVDESGAVCAIADPETAVKDGRLILPSDGCSSIAAGAFLSAPEGIREVYIPACITEIAEGAFAGLNETEWFSTDGEGSYVAVDGVLFSEGGACLFAFPAARIGIYKVPDEVVRFASDAFAGASISKLDARGCSLEDVGNLPEEIDLLRAPEEEDAGFIY